MQRFIFQIISVTKQKISNYRTKNASDDVGNPVVDTASAPRDEELLHDFCEYSVDDADEQRHPQGFSPIGGPIFLERLAVTPKAGKDESRVHQDMHHLVEPDNGLDTWKTRTRQSCQHQNYQCA